MSLSAAYSVGPVVINGTTISGITQSAATNGVSTTNPVETGNLWPTYAAVVGMRPGGAFSSRDVSAVLGRTGPAGVAIASSTGQYFKKRGAVGPVGTNTHRSYIYGAGVVVPLSMSCAHQGNATISCGIVPVSSDGATSPVAISNAATLPTEVSGNIDDVYTLWKASINGTTVTGMTGIDVDFGCQVAQLGTDSDIIDSVVGVVAFIPSVTFRGLDLDWINASSSVCDVLGEAVVHASTSFTFRRRGSLSNDAHHVKVTLNGVMFGETLADASGTGEGTTAIRLSSCGPSLAIAPIVLDLVNAGT